MAGAEITPLVSSGCQRIDSYGEGRFRISGVVHVGSVLVMPGRVEPWPVAEAAMVTFAFLGPITRHEPPLEILLVGCGKSFGPAPAELRVALRQAGVALEWMDTGAACRTFNVLLAEERRVAAALIAID